MQKLFASIVGLFFYCFSFELQHKINADWICEMDKYVFVVQLRINVAGEPIENPKRVWMVHFFILKVLFERS